MNLSRKIANVRVFPAFDLLTSGTRREELLLEKDKLNRIHVLRKFLSTMNSIEGMEFLISRVEKSETNAEFLDSMNKKTN
jgi:transcription termination factor Rho